jgi:hypothetical protein
MNATKLGSILVRAVGAEVSFSTQSWDVAPRWDIDGPLALIFRAIGAPPSQPGAKPQVKGRKQNEG